MPLLNLLFYGFAALTVLGGVWLVLTPHVLHAALALLLTLVSVAGLFVLWGADVAAVAQLMAYVGGVLVLTLFGIMLSPGGRGGPQSDAVNRLSGWALGGLTFAGLVIVLRQADFDRLPWRAGGAGVPVVTENSVVEAGIGLLTTAVLPVEIVSILLLIALIAAATIAADPVRD
ncbi:MAG: NADH-quinone oxidoreductase subunit J [Hymenobacteraceae bacterium]|nr:NADH-quinone oxidoreductase subunit J [Hymenobacteraceae bacterium]